MEQFKVLILLTVAIISLNSITTCAVTNQKEAIMKDETMQVQTNDTLFLSSKDYNIILLTDNILDVEVINKQKISLIKNVKYSIIKIEFQQDNKIAKGNDLLSATIPEDCDYFYPLDNGYILFINNRINFRKEIK